MENARLVLEELLEHGKYKLNTMNDAIRNRLIITLYSRNDFIEDELPIEATYGEIFDILSDMKLRLLNKES